MEKIGVIVNPNAKKVRKGKVSIEAFTRMKSERIDVRVTPTLEAIEDVLRDFKKAGVTYIGITGGDGSLHHVIMRMISVYRPDPIPAVVILKGGTMDNVAKSIGLRGKGDGILQRLLKALDRGKPVRICTRDLMKIDDRYCFLFGIGFVANFLNEVYQYEKGIISNARVVLKAVRDAFGKPEEGNLYRGIEATVHADAARVPYRKITAILAGTVENISRGITPLKQANTKERAFQALIAGFSGLQILARIYFLLGVRVTHPLMVNGLFSEMTIESDEGFDFTMDGDMYHCEGSMRIDMGPQIRLVRV
jgi:diacylglycerol kinase family enzyme